MMHRLRKFQHDTFQWAKATFPEATTETCFNHLKREIKEILADPSDMTEWADGLMLYLQAASYSGVNVDELLPYMQDKFAVNKQRDWGKKDNEGVYQHVEPANPAPSA